MTDNVRRLADYARAIGLAVVYVLTAELGLRIEAIGGHATLVWPPAGISIAALLLAGYGVFPGIALGAFAVNLYAGAPVWLALAIACGNTLEAFAGAYTLRKLTRFRKKLEGLYQVLGLVVFAALLSTLIAATVGSVGLLLASKVTSDGWAEAWRTWWVGDALGILIVAPLLLTLPGSSLGAISLRRWAEIVALTAVVVAGSAIVFLSAPSTFEGRHDDLRAQLPALPYLIFPPLIWAAIRFGLPGAARALFVVSAFAVYGTVAGSGPFVHETLGLSLFAAQTFMAVVAVTALVLGAIVSDRAQAIRRREDFLAIVSHDLKNPLNAIMMSSELLDRLLPPESDDKGRRQLSIIRRSTDRMVSLIRDLLDIVAIEAGRLVIVMKSEETGALLAEAAEMMQPMAAEKGQVLTVASPYAADRVLCDRERALQIFSNLIGNAIKFTPAGGKVTVAAELIGQNVQFSVADSGPGMTERQLAHIFDRFWRANPRSGGTGLGLSIAKGIVEAHGGTIWAKSVFGEGSRFFFTLQAPNVHR